MPVLVLIMDDRKPFRRAAREVVQETTFEVAGEAADGEESVAAA